MKTTTIERTSDTPSVMLDADRRLAEIIGNSYPENAVEFYQPINDWIKGYFAEGNAALIASLKLNYFNTSSAKCILNLFTILQEYHNNGKKVEVQWFYDEEDEDMLETGKAFSVDFNMPFDIRSYSV
jgi:SiaC family regulatory phosphoprotein